VRFQRTAADQLLQAVLTLGAGLDMDDDERFVGLDQLFFKQQNELFGART
jgi:hypothetical protein